MKTSLKFSLVAVLALSAGVSIASIAQSAGSAAAKPKPAKKPAAAIPDDPGERAFAANCSRCHNAPETLPPAVTGTVVRHMRVRANLSAEDERLILRFLAP